MKTLALAATVSLLAVTAAAAQDWRAAAQQDVEALHQEILENHPGLVTGGDEAGFAQRLAAGYATARQNASQVSDSDDYAYALRGFARSLGDSNTTFEPNWQQPPVWYGQLWNHMTTAWRNGSYVVTTVDSSVRGLPPVGATLVSCGDLSAEEFARARLDGWEGDLDLAADREQTAPYLFWDRGNSFSRALPASCQFSPNGRSRARDYTLTATRVDEATRRAAWAAAVYTPQTALAIETMPGGHWIHLHDLSQGDGARAFLDQVGQQLAALQGGNLVIDMRGARSGTSALGYSLANRLWGVDYRVAQEQVGGQVVYRVSPDNRQVFVDALGRMQADPSFAANYPTAIQEVQDLIAQFDAAAASGARTFSHDISSPASDAADAETAPLVNAMRGNVVVLVDGGCRNACVEVLDMLTTLPNVRVVGTPTGVDSIYIGQSPVALPSGHGYLSYGRQAWFGRNRGSEVGYTPAGGLAYTGNPTDEAAVRAWVASLFAG